MSDAQPDLLALTDDVGTLAPDQAQRHDANPAGDWPRLVRVRLPR